MRALISIPLFLLLLGSLRAEDAGDSGWRVMSFNIRYDNPGDGADAWPKRKDDVARFIQGSEVDIAGFQEVLANQRADLESQLPDFAVYGVGRDDGKERGEQVPIFWRKDRFEMLEQSTFWLSPEPDRPGSMGWDAAITRIASWVKLKDKSTGQTFYFINTHFDHQGEEARAKSATLLREMLGKKFPDHPVILTGDFNATPDSEPIRNLTSPKEGDAAFFDSRMRVEKPLGPNSTWCGFRKVVPGRRIDFVFTTADVQVRSFEIAAARKGDRFLSDHLPVLTELAIGSEAK